MKKSILGVAFFITVLSSCQNNSKTVNQGDAVVHDTIVSHEDHAQQETAVTLNNGEKWTANAETTEGINKMTALISDFTPQSNQDDYSSLKVQLETEFNMVLQKCTMTGDAHEQLHNYLIPMAEMFKQLSSEDMKVRSKTLDELKKHLAEYGNYFQ